MEATDVDICRVCRGEGVLDNPLYYPCVCTGSIKFIHQDCLVQWLKHSKKEYCELCKHRFHFMPIYSPTMPSRLPVSDLLRGLVNTLVKAIRFWIHYSLVIFSWLCVVPLSASRIYKCLFSGSFSAIISLPLDMVSTEYIITDILHGCFIVACTLCAFISLVWLREQILQGGGPDWLERDHIINFLAQHHRQPVVQEIQDRPEVVPNPAVQELVEADAVAPEDVQNNAEPGGAGAEADDGAADQVAFDALDNAADLINNNQEELTWERMLGLDGSMVFLEHVFWVICLNTTFTLIFAFLPYHLGRFWIGYLSIKEAVRHTNFEGVVTAFFGYMSVAVMLTLGFTIANRAQLNRLKRILGLAYVALKVCILCSIEIGAFPVACGWWIDMCSLDMFDASVRERTATFQQAPTASMFLHWILGMVFVFYIASFVMLLREVLRPGVLWFLRNLNDPDFNPIQEMIHWPIVQHLRRLFAFLISVVIFGSSILLLLYAPVRTVKLLFPRVLPYHVQLSTDAAVSELSLELLLLQVILPALLEQGQTRKWLKDCVRGWITMVAWLLNMESYMIGVPEDANPRPDVPNNDNDPNNGANDELFGPQGGGLQAAHMALLSQASQTQFQPYTKPPLFVARLTVLVVLMLLTMYLVSILALTMPPFLGRYTMSLWLGDTKVHELYTYASGLYLCWLIIRISLAIVSLVPQGILIVLAKATEWGVICLRCGIAACLLFGLIPLLFGLLFELVVVTPLRVPISQTPLYFPWQDWVLGILHAKILCAVTLIGPQWRFKRVLERVYQDGVRNVNLRYTFLNLIFPVLALLSVVLAIPYVLGHVIVGVFVDDFETANYVARRIYPGCLATVVICVLFVFQGMQVSKLYEHIKNDKYLIGKKLVNYERNGTRHRGKVVQNSTEI